MLNLRQLQVTNEEDSARILEIESAIKKHNDEVLKKCNNQDFDASVVLSPALKKRKLMQLKKLKCAVVGKAPRKPSRGKNNCNGPNLKARVIVPQEGGDASNLEDGDSNTKRDKNQPRVKVQLTFRQDLGDACRRCSLMGHKQRRCIQRPAIKSEGTSITLLGDK